jgi:hypothetical protein
MRKIIGAMLTAVLLSLGLSQSALAQSTCDDLIWSSEVTSRYANVADACQEVVTRDGSQYARLIAEVNRVRNNGDIRLRFKHRDGSWSNIVTVSPEFDFPVFIDGERVLARDLIRGQEIRIYMPSDRWAIAQIEEDAPVVIAVIHDEPEPEAIPETASPLPLIALLGFLFAGLGGALTMRRKS